MNRKNTLTIVLAFLLILTFNMTAWAKGSDHFTQENISKRIQAYIKVREETTSAVSLAFFKDGKEIYKKHYGYIDVENKLAADENSIYEWGSVSKVLTWVSVMQLVEENKLDLEADIKEYLPKNFLTKLSYNKKISLLDLMNHQGGFQEITYPVEFENSKDIPSLEQMLSLSQPSQIYEPATVTAYSNWSTALAGFIVERVSGQDYYQYVNENIFSPLGMKHTSVKADWSDNSFVQEGRQKSRSYDYNTEEKKSLGKSIHYIGLYPAGSCAGTLEDFSIFARQFTMEKSPLFQKKETLDLMKAPSLNYTHTKEGRVYHGLWSIDPGKKLLGHGGNTRGYCSSFWFDPQSNTGYVVMTNEQIDTTYNYGLAHEFFGIHQKKAPSAEDISGIYYSKRSIDKGFARFTKYLAGIMPIQKTDQEGLFKIMGGVELKILEKISTNIPLKMD